MGFDVLVDAAGGAAVSVCVRGCVYARPSSRPSLCVRGCVCVCVSVIAHAVQRWVLQVGRKPRTAVFATRIVRNMDWVLVTQIG
jgi:hypothetical protein